MKSEHTCPQCHGELEKKGRGYFHFCAQCKKDFQDRELVENRKKLEENEKFVHDSLVAGI